MQNDTTSARERENRGIFEISLILVYSKYLLLLIVETVGEGLAYKQAIARVAAGKVSDSLSIEILYAFQRKVAKYSKISDDTKLSF